jgi:predicted alpha/beta-fold hydrolase
VLAGLCEVYDEVARRRELPVPPSAVRRARTLREFDRLTVVPRFGFASPEDYYRRAGVGSRLHELRVPSLLVAATGDPMVDADGIRPALAAGHPALEVRWFRKGGHVSFPAAFDLGLGSPFGLEQQVLRWLLGQT